MIQRNFCTVEQATRLKELGILQEGCWFYDNNTKQYLEKDPASVFKSMYDIGQYVDVWTAQELKIMIGDRFEHPRMAKAKPVRGEKGFEAKGTLEFEVYYVSKMKSFKNEAHACADFLITILDNNVLDVEDVNLRVESRLKIIAH